MSANTINGLLGDALAYVEQAVIYLEEGDKENATSMMKVAEELVREAENMDGAKSNALYTMAVDALQKLEAQYNNSEMAELKKTVPLGAPPAYNLTDDGHQKPLDAQLLYWLPDGVQLVTIENGVTASPSPPASLGIFVVEQPKKSDSLYPSLEAAGHPNALIQVGPWVYPLNRDMSAILKNDLHTYVLPNPTEDHPDMFVGIILPPNIEKKLEDEFVLVLEQYAEVRSSTVPLSEEEKQRTSERIGEFLLKSGQRFALGVQKAVSRSESFMSEQGIKYRSTMKPTEKPVNINPVLRYGVSIMYRGSKTFAKITKSLLDTIGNIGVSIGTKLAPNGKGGSSGPGRLIGGAANVVGGGIAGASVVWISLEDASRQLFRSFANETVETVRVRYGEPASETTRQVLHGAGHTTMSAFQLWDLGPRSVAGRVARKAGIQFVHGISSKDSSQAIHELQQRVGDTGKEKVKK
ncbi:Senescence domain-containing protein [Aphelenchoides besseyi]|nr:Senescence domain-containing protein [Aphelenchoides besseyi]KAI6207465.1 Senescence domain-containing protein [Aphelenchoides besseyi]